MNSLRVSREALTAARKQFCLDIGMPWEEYQANAEQRVYIQKAVYKEGLNQVAAEGARVYAGGSDFFHAIICLGQLFLVVDEQIYDWAAEKFTGYPPEWFCEFGNLRMIDEKLQMYGHAIKDTHIYMLPGEESVGKSCCRDENTHIWFDRQEILRFRENNRFNSAICFWKNQPDMLAVAALKPEAVEDGIKIFDQSLMDGMAGVSADGEYLWQIGINVVKEAEGRGLAAGLVRRMKEAVIRQGKTPFYGTSESHTISQTVGLKAGFVPAWTEVFVK